jgi:hypothetical protein
MRNGALAPAGEWFCRDFHGPGCSSQLPDTRALRGQQSSPQQVQIGQRECGIEPRGVLGQPAVANLAKARQLALPFQASNAKVVCFIAPRLSQPLLFTARSIG